MHKQSITIASGTHTYACTSRAFWSVDLYQRELPLSLCRDDTDGCVRRL